MDAAVLDYGIHHRLPDKMRFAALFLVLAAPAFPQDAFERFQRFDVEDGLSQGTVSAILQDHQGYVWIGTNDGLNRFDGVEFKVFRHRADDPHSLSNSWVTRIFEDSEQVLWVGTMNGLNKLERNSGRFRRYYPTARGVSGSTILHIEESSFTNRQELLVYTRGPLRFNRITEEFLPLRIAGPPADSLLFVNPGSIRQDGAEHFWVGSFYGFFRLNRTTGEIDHKHYLAGGAGSLLLTQRERKLLWVRSRTGLLAYDPERQTLTHLLDPYISSVVQDRTGRVWVSTERTLFEARDSGMAISFVPRFHDVITTLNDDVSGGLWIGTFKGVLRMDNSLPRFSVLRHNPTNANSLAGDFVMPIMEDKTGSLWFGTFDAGVSILRHQPGTPPVFTHLSSERGRTQRLSSNNIRSLLQDRAGTVWIGTSNGLNILDPKNQTLRTLASLRSPELIEFWTESLLQSRDGTIWAGVANAVLLRIEREGYGIAPRHGYRKEKIRWGDLAITPYPLHGNLSDIAGEIDCMIEDKYGTLWMGTDMGLIQFDPKTESYVRFTSIPEDQTSISANHVWSILEDTSRGQHVLWVGTSAGLNRFHPVTGRSERILEQDGFPNACVYTILRDELGRLWLGTNQGITCFDDRAPAGKKFKNYSVADGLQGNEHNRRSACRLRTGEFLFGGTHGVTRFHPLQIRRNTYVPPVLLTSFSKLGKPVIFDQDIADVRSIDLQYDETVFAFEFTALSFANAVKNQYAYMMEGFDRGWTYCGTRRFASYTHLDPGEYVFRVKASNNDGVWNEAGLAITINIHPPFWGTWWFRTLSAVVAGFTLVAFYRRRIRGLEKDRRQQQEFALRLLQSQEQERKRIAGELHDSLGQNLLVIRNRALLGLNDPSLGAQARDQLDKISSVATQSIDGVREISYNLRPYQLDRLGLTKAITSLVAAVGESSTVRFTSEIAPIDDEVESDKAIHVYRIVQEGINNILKHASATEARIIVRVEASNIRIVINDNGIGIRGQGSNGPRGRGGFGNIGLTERARVLNGTVAIKSRPGKGTTLTFLLPRTSQHP